MKNMLSTARAIVVDDQYEQVEPAVKALARLGIGSVYLSGKLEEKPPAKLHGVRLAVVDMDLGQGGTGQSDAETAHQTLAFLTEVLAEDSNPLMVIVWTGSDGVYEEFKAAFGDVLTGATPAVICRLDKGKFDLASDGGVEAAAEEFRKLIIDELEKVKPLDVLWAWEQAVHDAASRTTSMVAEIIRTPDLKPETWPEGASHLLAAIARAAAGNRHDDQRALLDDLLSTFEPLLQDRIEHHRLDDYEALQGSAKLILERVTEQNALLKTHSDHRQAVISYEAFQKALADVNWANVDLVTNTARDAPETNAGRKKTKIGGLLKAPTKPAALPVSDEQASRLNGMLQWSVLPVETKGVRPGNIYPIGDKDTPVREAVERLGVDLERLKRDTLAKSSLSGQPVLVEATPACDYAQGKWTMARFVMGYLVSPTVRAKLADKSDFLRIYGAAWQSALGADPTALHLVLNSHFCIAAAMPEAAGWEATLRLRRPTLADLQVWLAAQHMRQGLLHVTP
jgi:hypothetical protein